MLLDLGLIAPPSGIAGNVIAGLQCTQILTVFAAETSNPTLYSKFACDMTLENPISSRNGMLRIYIPSALVAATRIVQEVYGLHDPSLVSLMLLVHFLKRTLEVAFLHSYSGHMPSSVANMIGFYYALITLLVAWTAVPISHIASLKLMHTGVGLFVIGELGNFYHHYLLKQLREEKTVSGAKEKRYMPPRDGLFVFVATPHYLCELVAWLGIACVAQQLHSFLVFASMSSYLAGRAVMTNSMYRERFSTTEWPRSRKALIPFLY
jgi:very-long-chain enoyl-CoA reductase